MSQKRSKRAIKNQEEVPNTSKGGRGRKILNLADFIMKESSNMKKRAERCEELAQVLCSIDVDESVIKACLVLMHGGNGLLPLISIFKKDDAPERFKKSVAKCMGMIATIYAKPKNSKHASDHAEYLNWIICKFENCGVDGNNEEKKWLLETLEQSLKHIKGVESPKFSSIMPKILQFFKREEENHSKIVLIIQLIGELQPEVIRDSLSTILWGLFNWMVSRKTSKATVKLLRDSVAAFSSYWSEDSLIYAVNSVMPSLLKNLQESLQITNLDDVENHIFRIPVDAYSSIRNFKALLLAICNASFPDYNTNATLDLKSKQSVFLSFGQNISHLFQMLEIAYIPSIGTENCWCFEMFSIAEIVFKVLGSENNIEPHLIGIITGQALDMVEEYEDSRDMKYLMRWVVYITSVIKVWPNPIPIALKGLVFGKDSFFLGSLRSEILSANSEYMELLHEFFAAVLSKKDCVKPPHLSIFPIIQETKDLQTLVEGNLTSIPPNLTEFETKHVLGYDPAIQRRLLLFNIKLLGFVTNGSCLNVASDEVFRLLLKMHESLNLIKTQRLGYLFKLSTMILSSLFKLAKGNGFFLSSQTTSDQQPESFKTPRAFHDQMLVLDSLLQPNNFGRNVLGFNWLNSLITFVAKDKFVHSDMIFVSLEKLLLKALDAVNLERDPKSRARIAQIWSKYLGYFGYIRHDQPKTSRLLKTIHKRLQDIDENVRNSFFIFSTMIDPFDCFIALDQINMNEEIKGRAYKKIMDSGQSRFFGQRQLDIVFSYLGFGQYLQETELSYHSNLDVPIDSWLPKMFYLCQGNLSDESTSEELSLEMMITWLLWQSGLVMIENKLSTSFGGPIQTLEAIEHTIDSYLQIFNQDFELEEDKFISIMRRLSHVLLFIEMLEIQISNAANGSFASGFVPSNSTVLFFHANQKVCDDWFSRLRSKGATAGDYVHNYGIAIRFVFEELADSNPSQNVDKFIKMLLVLCNFLLTQDSNLQRRKDADGMVGLAKYLEVSLKDKIELNKILIPACNFFLASAHLIEGRIAIALEIFWELLTTLDRTENQVLRSEVIKQLTECLINVKDIEGLKDVLKLNTDVSMDHAKFMLSSWSGFQMDFKPSCLSRQSAKSGVLSVLSNDLQQQFMIKKMKKQNLSQTELSNLLHPYQFRFPMDLEIRPYFEGITWAQAISKMLKHPKSDHHGTKTRINLFDYCSRNLTQWVNVFYGLSNGEQAGCSDQNMQEIQNFLVDLSIRHHNFRLARELMSQMPKENSLVSYQSFRSAMTKARLLYVHGDADKALNMLLEIVDSVKVGAKDSECLALIAKACELFENWNSRQRIKFDKSVELKYPNVFTAVGLSEYQPGNFLKYGVTLAPNYHQSWYTWANFSYKSAIQILSDLAEEKVDNREMESIIEIATRYQLSPSDILHWMRAQLDGSTFQASEKISESFVDDISEIFNAVKHRFILHVKDAASSYFEYLKLHGHENGNQSSVSSQSKSQANSLTASLRLIKLYTSHAEELQNIFDQGFRNTPLKPWKMIIPQIFSRLNNSKLSAEEGLTNLICRIGESAPQSVIYAVVLGANNDASDRNFHDKIASSLINKGFEKLIMTMKTWTMELQRITVLWDEMWQHALEHTQGDTLHRLDQLEHDIKRIKSNPTLKENVMREILSSTTTSLLQPIFASLEKVCDKTINNSPASANEVAFVNKYEKHIRNAMKGLKQVLNEERPRDVWRPFASILKSITESAKKARTYPLVDISPFLDSLHDTIIQIPGLDSTNPITITGCGKTVLNLPTKTKPKKIEFIGSDGNVYSYLLKGHEDMHLDERIEQLFNTVNILLLADTDAVSRNLSARTYKVMPFGYNYGMIEWINNASGLFVIYRKWLHWEQTVKLMQKKGQPQVSHGRAQERYLELLHKRLAECKISKKTPRNEIPVEILLSVFKTLQSETSDRVFAKEIWGSCISPQIWWDKTANFARSVAVMSILGYVLGLGDRHLDNILLDLERGELIHIDFNICFEKGKRLRIPETVPFRLTQNIVKALGPTGIEGKFRIACCHTLRVCRQNEELFSTLLEAFIYDPLFDWNCNSSQKKVSELNLHFGLLNSRLLEQKSQIEDIKSKLANSISESRSFITDWNSKIASYKYIEQALIELNGREFERKKMQEFETLKSESSRWIMKLEEQCQKDIEKYDHALSKLDDVILLLNNLSGQISDYLNEQGHDKRVHNDDFCRNLLRLFQNLLKNSIWYAQIIGQDREKLISQSLAHKLKKLIRPLVASGFESVEELKSLCNMKGFDSKLDQSLRLDYRKEKQIIMKLEHESKMCRLAGRSQSSIIDYLVKIPRFDLYLFYQLSEFGSYLYSMMKGTSRDIELKSFMGQSYDVIEKLLHSITPGSIDSQLFTQIEIMARCTLETFKLAKFLDENGLQTGIHDEYYNVLLDVCSRFHNFRRFLNLYILKYLPAVHKCIGVHKSNVTIQRFTKAKFKSFDELKSFVEKSQMHCQDSIMDEKECFLIVSFLLDTVERAIGPKQNINDIEPLVKILVTPFKDLEKIKLQKPLILSSFCACIQDTIMPCNITLANFIHVTMTEFCSKPMINLFRKFLKSFSASSRTLHANSKTKLYEKTGITFVDEAREYLSNSFSNELTAFDEIKCKVMDYIKIPIMKAIEPLVLEILDFRTIKAEKVAFDNAQKLGAVAEELKNRTIFLNELSSVLDNDKENTTMIQHAREVFRENVNLVKELENWPNLMQILKYVLEFEKTRIVYQAPILEELKVKLSAILDCNNMKQKVAIKGFKEGFKEYCNEQISMLQIEDLLDRQEMLWKNHRVLTENLKSIMEPIINLVEHTVNLFDSKENECVDSWNELVSLSDKILNASSNLDEFDIQVLDDLGIKLESFFEYLNERAESRPNLDEGKEQTEGRNRYAIQALSKIRSKLLGKVDGASLTVDDQVDMLIKEAMDEKKLSKMYEGWMPWV